MFTRSPKFINLKTDPSLFEAKPKQSNNASTQVFQPTNAINTTNTNTKIKSFWSLWSAILWVMFVLGVVLMIAGFYKSLTNKNTVDDKTKADKPYKDLAISMLAIGFVVCFVTFIISFIANIRMF